MRNLFLLLLLSVAFMIAKAQSTRMVLAEGFTSSTCGPCGQQNPAFDALLHANEDIITSVKFHMSWPAPGNDPMYLHNTVDNNARRTYYNVGSVPHVFLNGDYFNGVPASISQSTINAAAAITSPFEIQLQHRLTADEDSVYVTMLIKATNNVSGQLVAHIAVIEKEIHFASPPGTNGERDFYNVMKALLPSRSGTQLSAFQTGDYVIIQTAWALANVYNNDQIAAVAYVQDNTTKHVHQAAVSSTNAIVPVYANDAAVTEVMNVTSTNCSGRITPAMQLTNYGSDNLTSATVVFSINGVELQTIEWTGEIGFLESAIIEAGELEFMLQEENQLTVDIASVNGQNDNYLNNNVEIVPIAQSPNLAGNLLLFILLDNSPQETSWEITNSLNEVVQSGGPYSTAGGVISVPIVVEGNDCYDFMMYDAGGNGLCCSNGTGYYALITNGNESVFTGQDFGSVDHNQFAYGLTGTTEQMTADMVSLSPNPTRDVATVTLSLLRESHVIVKVFDLPGKQVAKHDFGRLMAGSHQLNSLNTQLPKGIYVVSVMVGEQTINKKLIVQ